MIARQKTQVSQVEKLAWLRLARAENVGPVTFYRLIEAYGSATRALEAVPALASRGGRKKPLTIPPPQAAEKELGALEKIGGMLVTAAEPEYPLALSSLEDAPPVLSVRGDVRLFARPSLSIVGARNASVNGRKFAESLARELGRRGQVIVSGLARGIDTAAHDGSLETGTVAVVAGGIDVVYPPENQKLYEQICERGLVVAASPFGLQPFAQSFPRRNRIVSGLSAGTVIVEATLKSGSLITARLAAEQGRDVYAVPGHPLDPRAEGPNHLIREGATLVRGADDILEFLNTFTAARQPPKQIEDSAPVIFRPRGSTPVREAGDSESPRMFDEAREAVLAALSPAPTPVDDLLVVTGLDVPLLQTVLLELEVAGSAQRLPGNRVALITSSEKTE